MPSGSEVKNGITISRILGFRQVFSCVVEILYRSGMFIIQSLITKVTNDVAMAIVARIAPGLIC